MDWNTIIMWVRLATVIIAFVASCIGMGYFAESWVLHRKLPGWVSALLSFAIGFVWPVIAIGYIIDDAQRHLSQYPHDDAPGMIVAIVLFVGAPLLWVLSFALGLIGAFIARRRNVRRVFR